MRFIDPLWRDTRGGVHTEGAMVALFLAMMFGGFLWVHSKISRELATVRDASHRLWPRALEGCESGVPAAARGWVGGYRSIQRDIAPSAAEHLDDVVASEEERVDVDYAERPPILGGGLVEVRTETGTECNTAMPEGEIAWAQRVKEIFCARWGAVAPIRDPSECEDLGPASGGE